MTERARVPLRPATQGHPRACTQTYPGRADQVPKVRAFVARAAAGCPAVDEVVLMADEIAANAVLHSRSGEPGGWFTVRVEVGAGQWVGVQVDDEGGPQPPRLRSGSPAGDGADGGGRGLRIVEVLADAWGVTGDVTGRTVWFRAGWGAEHDR